MKIDKYCKECKIQYSILPDEHKVFRDGEQMSGIYFDCKKCGTSFFIPRDNVIMTLAIEKYGFIEGIALLPERDVQYFMRQKQSQEGYMISLKYRQNREAIDLAIREFDTGQSLIGPF